LFIYVADQPSRSQPQYFGSQHFEFIGNSILWCLLLL